MIDAILNRRRNEAQMIGGQNSGLPLFPSLELNVNVSPGAHIETAAKDAVAMSNLFSMNLNVIFDRCEIFVVPNMTTEQEIIDEFMEITNNPTDNLPTES